MAQEAKAQELGNEFEFTGIGATVAACEEMIQTQVSQLEEMAGIRFTSSKAQKNFEVDLYEGDRSDGTLTLPGTTYKNAIAKAQGWNVSPSEYEQVITMTARMPYKQDKSKAKAEAGQENKKKARRSAKAKKENNPVLYIRSFGNSQEAAEQGMRQKLADYEGHLEIKFERTPQKAYSVSLSKGPDMEAGYITLPGETYEAAIAKASKWNVNPADCTISVRVDATIALTEKEAEKVQSVKPPSAGESYMPGTEVEAYMM